MEDINNIINLRNLIIYIIAINLITFFAMFIDKKKAQWGKWRIKESTLLTLSLLGGSIGGLAGMYTFRHKTQKARFYIGIPAILILQIILTVYLIIKF